MQGRHSHRQWNPEGRPYEQDAPYIRRRHGRGGPFGGGFGPGGPFGPGFGPGGPRGRGRRRRGDVRIALLLLLAEAPANGYQLMQTLEERTEGRWRPSPGSVYPALAQLEDEGLVRSAQAENESGRTFEITDAGRQHLTERGDKPAPWEDDDDDETDAYRAFRRALVSTAKAASQVAQDGDPAQVTKAVEILKETRKALYRLLAGDDE